MNKIKNGIFAKVCVEIYESGNYEHKKQTMNIKIKKVKNA